MHNSIDLLLVGSSIIRKWKTFSTMLRTLQILNLCISSYTTEDMLTLYYINMISVYKPKNVIYYCGNNDIRENIDPEIIIKNIKKFVNIIKKLYGTNMNIMIVSLIKNPKTPVYDNSIDIVNSKIQKYSKNSKNVYFVDVMEELYDTKYFMKDDIHLEKSGYAKLNKEIENTLSHL